MHLDMRNLFVMADIEVKIPTPALDAVKELSSDATWWERWVGWGNAIALAFWNRPFVSILVLMMILDMVTGVTKTWIIKTGFSSQFSAKSHGKKIQMLVSVLFGMVLDMLLPFPLPPLTWASLIAAWHCYTEGLSICENLEASGISMPTFIRSRLEQVRKEKLEELEREVGTVVREEIHVHSDNVTLVDTSKPDSKAKLVPHLEPDDPDGAKRAATEQWVVEKQQAKKEEAHGDV